MKSTVSRIIALVIGLGVLIAAPSFAAPTAPTKEEVVYAHTDADGRVAQIYVVNSFRDPSGTITDYGRYSEVVNLTTTDQLVLRDDRVEIATPGGDFYYQGKFDSNDMPWRLGFEYRLDGQPISAEQLKGASGNFELRIKVRQNENVDPVYFEHYMLQIQVNLPAEYFRQIDSEGATIASAGETKVVNLTAMPGKDADLVVTAKASNAHLGQIQAVGLPFEMMIELPDASQYTADLLQLQNGIAELADGVTEFTNGVGAVDGAAAELSSGAATLSSSAAQIASGFDHLAAGRGDFDAALGQYNQGVQGFAAGLVQLGPGVGELTGGIDQLVTGSDTLASGLSGYSAGMSQFSGGVDQSAAGGQALAGGLGTLTSGLGELTQQGKYAEQNLVDSSAQILASLQGLQLALQAPLNQDEADQLNALLSGFAGALAGFEGSVSQVDFAALLTSLDSSVTSLDAAASSIETVAAELQNSEAITAELGIDVSDNPEAQALLGYLAGKGAELAGTAGQLRTVQTTLTGLSDQIATLSESLQLMSGQFEAMNGLIQRVQIAVDAISPAQIAMLQAGLSDLVTGYTDFNDGLVSYVSGVEAAYLGLAGVPGLPEQPGLLAGAQALSGGLDELSANGQELAGGAADLASGAGALHEGMLELQAGVGQFGSQSDLLVDGASELANGGWALVNGHAQLVAGESQFGSGLRQYADGMGAYSSGAAQYAQGVGELGAAAPQLAGGANQLRDETRNMDEQMAERIDDAMADFLPGDYELVSFVDAKNTGIKRVQFIYLIDAQAEPEHSVEPTPEDDRSWWQRILDIFR